MHFMQHRVTSRSPYSYEVEGPCCGVGACHPTKGSLFMLRRAAACSIPLERGLSAPKEANPLLQTVSCASLASSPHAHPIRVFYHGT